jgi:tight adherence protein B
MDMTTWKIIYLSSGLGLGKAATTVLLTHSVILGSVSGLLGAATPVIWERHCREKHRRLLAVQLRQSLQTMTHALRVGASFLQALERVAMEGEPPLAPFWTRLLQGIRLGQPLSEGLASLPGQIPIKEVGWFVTAVQVTQQTGGSLAGVLETLANTLQERETFREKVSALTSQGKASGYLLCVLPFVLMVALWVIAPDIMAPLFHTTAGQSIIAGVVVSVSLGLVVIQKIVSVRTE